jgi:hypothetical protein
MFDAPPHDQDSVASASMNWRVYVIVPLLFIAAAAPSALRKDVTQGFDEVAHAFYIANLQSTGETLAIPVTAAFCAFGGRSAGLSLLDAIERPSVRAVLPGFLIAGPVVFRLVGTPTG